MLNGNIQGSLNVLMTIWLAWIRPNFLLFIQFSVLSCNVKSQKWIPGIRFPSLSFIWLEMSLRIGPRGSIEKFLSQNKNSNGEEM